MEWYKKHYKYFFFFYLSVYIYNIQDRIITMNKEIKITRAIKQDWTLTRAIDYLSTPAHATKSIKQDRVRGKMRPETISEPLTFEKIEKNL